MVKVPDDKYDQDTFRKALDITHSQTEMRTIATGVTVAFVAIVGALTYSCGGPKEVDQEALAKIASEEKVKITCIQKGMTWRPVISVIYSSGATESQMGCVTNDFVEQPKLVKQ